MRTARELAEEFGYGSRISELTAAIEARDAEHAVRVYEEQAATNDAVRQAATLREQLRIAREALQIYVDNEGGTHMPAEEALRALTSLTPPPSPADEGEKR